MGQAGLQALSRLPTREGTEVPRDFCKIEPVPSPAIQFSRDRGRNRTTASEADTFQGLAWLYDGFRLPVEADPSAPPLHG
jgi:hypothetical protein